MPDKGPTRYLTINGQPPNGGLAFGTILAPAAQDELTSLDSVKEQPSSSVDQGTLWQNANPCTLQLSSIPKRSIGTPALVKTLSCQLTPSIPFELYPSAFVSFSDDAPRDLAECLWIDSDGLIDDDDISSASSVDQGHLQAQLLQNERVQRPTQVRQRGQAKRDPFVPEDKEYTNLFSEKDTYICLLNHGDRPNDLDGPCPYHVSYEKLRVPCDTRLRELIPRLLRRKRPGGRRAQGVQEIQLVGQAKKGPIFRSRMTHFEHGVTSEMTLREVGWDQQRGEQNPTYLVYVF